MKGMRLKEKEIKDKTEMLRILRIAKYVTVAMCTCDEPYLVTMNHGYDSEKEAIYLHCAQEGKKIDILKSNNVVWGQAIIDKGYVAGKCDHLYATTQFRGTAAFVDDIAEKRHALTTMIRQLEPKPGPVMDKQITEESLKRVNIIRIDINYLSGKKSEEAGISL